MKIKIQLRKLNRGIILGVLLIAGVVAYTLISNAVFKRETPEIRELIKGYLNEMADFNTNREGLELGTNPTADAISAKADQLTAILNKYYASFGDENTGRTPANMIGSYKSFLEYNGSESAIFSFDFNMKDSDYTISKYGPNGAKVSVSLSGDCVMSERGNFFLTGSEGYGWGKNDYYGYGTSLVNLSEYSTSYNGTFECYVIRKNGEWKIDSVRSSYINYYNTLLTKDNGYKITDTNMEREVFNAAAEMLKLTNAVNINNGGIPDLSKNDFNTALTDIMKKYSEMNPDIFNDLTDALNGFDSQDKKSGSLTLSDFVKDENSVSITDYDSMNITMTLSFTAKAKFTGDCGILINPLDSTLYTYMTGTDNETLDMSGSITALFTYTGSGWKIVEIKELNISEKGD